MKLSACLLLAAFAGLGLSVVLAKPPSPAPPLTGFWMRTNGLVWHTNSVRLGRHSPGLLLGSQPPPAPIVLPGTYVCEPYTCLLVVPGPHPDDKCVIASGGPRDPMPMFKPELRLVPFGQR